MFRNFTVLSLVLFLSFSLFAQDLDIHKKSASVNIKTNTVNKSMNSHSGKLDKLQTLFLALPSNGYYAGTTSVPYAPTGYRKYERMIYLITPAEMAALGIPSGTNVNEIAWTYYQPGLANVTVALKVYLQNTTDIAFTKSTTWATSIAPMTLVDNNASVLISSTSGALDEPFSLPTAFSYTGGGVYVAFDLTNTGTTTTGTYVDVTTVAAGTGTYDYYSAQNATTQPTTMTNGGKVRPQTYLGFAINNDIQVSQVYTLGKLPIPFATPHVVSAAIQNNSATTKTNINVTLNITGANTHSEVVQIPTLASGYYTTVDFTSWTPTIIGTNTITVSVPSDDINSNNSKSVTQLIT